MQHTVFWVLPFFLLLFSCQSGSDDAAFAKSVEMAHHKDAFLKKEVISFDFLLEFGGKERMNARLYLETNSNRARIKYKDGREIIVIKDSVFYSPGFENTDRIRFDAYTWSYFFLFPFKLTDPGTQWNDWPKDTLNGKQYLAEKLSFAPGTGDAPDDWYIAYADPESNLLQVGAYIVTANKSVEKAEEDPHAIEYRAYQLVEGIPLANYWVFWEWREEAGLTRKLGNASLRNFTFEKLTEELFQVPEGFLSI